ncbi:MAG TPA: DUF2141 domain-containing protein [Polyangiaceae bacterium]|nr:DUF2141 domain-containing protein [Polyangiaceae bacterium]
MNFARFALATLAALPFVMSTSAYGESGAGHSAVRLEVAVASPRGRVLCAVYERDGWLKRPIHASASAIRGNVAVCEFGDLKPGTYAAGAFQDENMNGRLDRSWTGGAAEPWCVSNETRGTFGPPSFSSASFPLREGTVNLRCRAR